MIAILKKEINTFFTSAIGYVVIGSFLIINSLFLWFFKGAFNILDAGFADLISFFELAPWVLIFLAPAITMKSFSEEMKNGTIELLLTKPITIRQLILGKFLGTLIVVYIALLPTLIYIYPIWKLGDPRGNLALGSILGSYLGLYFLSAVFTSIGILTSSFSENQVTTYILGVFSCFIFFYGFEGISHLGWDIFFFESIGLKSHFQSIGRGVLDTRDIIYFFALTTIFIILTETKIKTSIS